MTNLYAALQVPRRRPEFFNATFDEMVEKVLTLEAQLEEMTEDRDDLLNQISELEAQL